MKFNTLLLFPLALIAIIVIMRNPNRAATKDANLVLAVSLQDSLPESFITKVAPHEIQGYRVVKSSTESISFFEYRANHQRLLKELARLPFAADSVRADTQTRIITDALEIRQVAALLKEQSIADHFQMKEPISDYEVHHCLKTPQQHYVLLHKESDRVIHLVHQS